MGRRKRQRDAEENTPPTAKQLKIADFYDIQVPIENRFSALIDPEDDRVEDKDGKVASRHCETINNSEELYKTPKGTEAAPKVLELIDQPACSNLLQLTAGTVELIFKELRMLNQKMDSLIKEQEESGQPDCEAAFGKEVQSLVMAPEQGVEIQYLTPEKDLKDSFLALPDLEQLEIIKRLETLKYDLIKSKDCQNKTSQSVLAPRDPSCTKAPPILELLSPKGQNTMEGASQISHQVQQDEVHHEIELDLHLTRALSYEPYSEKAGKTWAQELAEITAQNTAKNPVKEANHSGHPAEEMELRQNRAQGKNGCIFTDHLGKLNQISSD
uniref:Uncharacterized protein n=1 Tax=Sphaerodactylus townsendi TaxID=933632 RepID=A0ACB8E7G9_9SAUR